MEQARLNKFFHTREFVCKCGCGLVNIDPDFIKKLTEARRIADVAFVINSGCRCAAHNRAVGGASLSGHLASLSLAAVASDIRADDVDTMAAILKGAFEAEIPGIGIGEVDGHGFVHLDTKPRRMIKVYGAFTLTARGFAA